MGPHVVELYPTGDVSGPVLAGRRGRRATALSACSTARQGESDTEMLRGLCRNDVDRCDPTDSNQWDWQCDTNASVGIRMRCPEQSFDPMGCKIRYREEECDRRTRLQVGGDDRCMAANGHVERSDPCLRKSACRRGPVRVSRYEQCDEHAGPEHGSYDK
jgi:hypothetical protein